MVRTRTIFRSYFDRGSAAILDVLVFSTIFMPEWQEFCPLFVSFSLFQLVGLHRWIKQDWDKKMSDGTVISTRNLKPVAIDSRGEFRVVNMGTMEIWDGEELSLIREAFRRLMEEEECLSMGVDMRYVKYVPSGFFGTLCDWHDKGVCVRVFGPLPNVKQMLWFTTFFQSIGDNVHELRPSNVNEFEESTSDCESVQESVMTDESCRATKNARSSSVPLQAN